MSYGYNPSNASTFNQLTQQGVSATDAAKQSGVSTNPAAYGYGTNANLGAVIPAAGGTPDSTGFTKVSYAQNYSGQPAQETQVAMNAKEIGEFTGRNSGFGVQEISPGNFVPTISVTAAPPDPNSPGGNGGTNTVQDPAQRAASEQVQATAAGAGATPFSQDPAQRAAAQVAATNATPASNPFSQDPAQRAAAQVAATNAAAVDSPTFVQAPGEAGRGTASPGAVTSSFVQAPGEAGRGTAPTAAAGDVPSSFVQAPGEAGRGTVPTAAASDVSSSFVQAPGEAGRGTVPTPAPAPVSPALAKPGESLQAQAAAAAGSGTTPANAVATPASQTEAEKLLAQRQEAIAAQKRLINNNGDWRFRISLAEGSTYLYNAPFPELGILAPLAATHGVIFPYTPKVDVSYKATYSTAELTHSNYTNYFYQGSSVNQIRVSGAFTAQDTVEANYLLAVIHFFRSASKMFYGQDAQRGAPPPLLFLSGFGEYQFNNHPCVLTNFEYNLPSDVDYIRAGSPNSNGTDLLKRRTSTQNNLPTNPISGALGRLNQLFSGQGVQKGGIVYQNAPSNLSKNSPTYVPTKIDISLSLLPIVTRNQASRQFSLKQFANGDLVKQGFW